MQAPHPSSSICLRVRYIQDRAIRFACSMGFSDMADPTA